MWKEDRGCQIFDVSVPADCRVNSKESENIEKYQDLKRGISAMWAMRKVQAIPVVVGALGAIIKGLNKSLQNIGIIIRTGHVLKTALLIIARILQIVLEVWEMARPL